MSIEYFSLSGLVGKTILNAWNVRGGIALKVDEGTIFRVYSERDEPVIDSITPDDEEWSEFE